MLTHVRVILGRGFYAENRGLDRVAFCKASEHPSHGIQSEHCSKKNRSLGATLRNSVNAVSTVSSTDDSTASEIIAPDRPAAFDGSSDRLASFLAENPICSRNGCISLTINGCGRASKIDFPKACSSQLIACSLVVKATKFLPTITWPSVGGCAGRMMKDYYSGNC